LEFLEENFHCGGICAYEPVYLFSNLNAGLVKHQGGCREYIIDFIEKYGKVIYVVAFISMAFMFINTIAAFCLCCRRKHPQAEAGIYQRMDFFDEWYTEWKWTFILNCFWVIYENLHSFLKLNVYWINHNYYKK